MSKKLFKIGKSKSKKKRAKKQEKEWAIEVNGKPQPNSGAVRGFKGDVREPSNGILKDFLWENKYTDFSSFRIKAKTWRKIEREAYSQGNIPGMEIKMKDNKGKDIELVIIDKNDFKDIKYKEGK